MDKIKEIRKLKRLYSVTFEGEQEKLYLTEDTIIKFMLSKGATLESGKIKDIVNFSNYSRGKNLAIYYISFKMRTKTEVQKYLREHEIPEADIPKILSELEASNFINDEKYAENYISGKISVGNSGPYILKQKLLQRGISEKIIEEKLTETYDENEQLENAISLAEKMAISKSSRLPLKQLKIKISQSLTRKGFSYSVASAALDTLKLEMDEENEYELLESEAEKLYHRLSMRYDGYDLKNHLSQSLGRKGFDWGIISDVLKNYNF